MEDNTVRIGLLLETAEAHQASATATLDRLREHAAGLDQIVRDEVRATLLEELHNLHDDTQRAAATLRSLARRANHRVAGLGAGVVLMATAVPLVLASWLLPSPAEVLALASQRDQLRSEVARLTREGGAVELRRCGTAQRLCARIDRTAPRYGESADLVVLKGY